ncbi:MAG TPA: hypothetical protein VNE41_01305 [Chitinophagaceae bacterium]|nr:hypothetical protein [Chitinophagaceae bacterium]
MKKFMIISLILLASFRLATAKIWRVNNTSGISADYTTPQAAHDGAASGDTIQIEGSLISYGPVTCTKPLVWIGPGYFLAENPQTQYSLLTAIGLSFTFNTGSSGSCVMGMNSPNIYINENNIKVLRNLSPGIYLGQTTGNTYSGDTIAQNFICNIFNYPTYSTFSNLQIFDNSILNLYLDGPTTNGDLYSNYIENVSYVNNFLVEDNIISGDTINIRTNNTFLNNILYNGTNTTANGNGNFYVAPFTGIFTNYANRTTIDAGLELAAGSPAKGAGIGGIDLGIFGNGTPYMLSGMAPIPSIYTLTVPATVAAGSNSMSVTVSIKSHN